MVNNPNMLPVHSMVNDHNMVHVNSMVTNPRMLPVYSNPKIVTHNLPLLILYLANMSRLKSL